MAAGGARPAPASWFLALPVPDAVRHLLASPLADLSVRHDDLAWTRPEGWHVTVAFLGRPDPAGPGEVLARARAAVADVPVDRDPVVLGEPVVLGRAVALSVGPAGWLRDLHGRVLANLSAAGLVSPSGSATFRPHVTLARTRGSRGGRVPAAVLAELATLATRTERRWDPVSLALMASHRGHGPAHYTTVMAVSLPT